MNSKKDLYAPMKINRVDVARGIPNKGGEQAWHR